MSGIIFARLCYKSFVMKHISTTKYLKSAVVTFPGTTEETIKSLFRNNSLPMAIAIS